MYGGSVIDIETSLATHALDELRALSGVMEVTRDDEIKELLLSPATSLAIIAGKVLAGSALVALGLGTLAMRRGLLN